jgi:hypothetical protein
MDQFLFIDPLKEIINVDDSNFGTPEFFNYVNNNLERSVFQNIFTASDIVEKIFRGSKI